MVEPLPPVRLARLTDYLGLWAMEFGHVAALADALGRCDPLALSARAPAPPAAGVETVTAKGDKRIAVVRILGPMMKGQSWWGGTSTIQTRRDLRAATADPSVSGILLAIDSPGGTVAGTADLAADVKAARRKKPVFAHIDDMAASAAYWIASQADQVWANQPTADVGNIGTVGTVIDESRALEAKGVKVHVIATGPLKRVGMGTPISDEQLAYLQAIVDENQSHFDAAVRAGRGLMAEHMKEVRSGAIYTATRAKELKLIDGIRPMEQTLAALAAAG
jgi:signal peptide peptidase SppA